MAFDPTPDGRSWRPSPSDRDIGVIHGAANVKWFGARGDGGTDDTAAFQRAFDAVADHGGAVHIPPGRYRIRCAPNEGCVYIRGNDIHVFGHGPQSVIFIDDPGTGTPKVASMTGFWIIGNASRLCFENFEFLGRNDPYEGTRSFGNMEKAIRHGGEPPDEFMPGNSATDWTFRRVGFRNMYHHVMYSPGAPNGGRWRVEGCYVEKCLNGINFNVPDVVYQSCRLYATDGIETSDQRFAILDCTFIDSNGISAGGNGNPPSAGPQIIGNRFYNVSGQSQADSESDAITVAGCTGAIIKNNYIDTLPTAHHGIVVKDTTVFGVVAGPSVIEGNVILTGAAGNHGIWLPGGPKSIVTNNHIVAGAAALLVAVADCLVQGNWLDGVSSDLLLQNADRTRVADNRMAGGLSKLSLQGTTTGITVSTFGTGVPTAALPNGSTFMRTDGGAGSTLYVREGGAWVAK